MSGMRGQASRRRVVAVGVLMLLVLLGRGWAASAERVVAIGDVHGSYSGLIKMLVRTGMLDAGGHWNGGSQILVQTGDLLDRGAHVRPVLDLMIRLQSEAEVESGKVIVLLGNHEGMGLLGMDRYLNPEALAAFAGRGSKRALSEVYAQRRRFWRRRAPALGLQVPPWMSSKREWMRVHPPGWVEYRKALARDGDYGHWLRSLSAVAVVGDTLFVHGGLGPGIVGMDVDAINARVAGEIATFDRARIAMETAELVPPLASLGEMMRSARAVAGTPLEGRLDPELRQLLDQVRHAEEWYLLSPDGPLWFRGQADLPEEEGGELTARHLDRLGARRMVAGHTPSQNGRIHVRFGGRAFLIDTGMLTEAFTTGRPSALDLRGETVTAVYPDGREHLAGPVGPSHITGLGGHPEFLDAEGRPLPMTSPEEILEFLRTAHVVHFTEIERGVNPNYRLLLEKGGVRARAAYRLVDRSEADFPMESEEQRKREFGGSLRDRAIFEAAAFQASLLLGIHSVPPAVERRVEEIRVSGPPPRSTVQLWLSRMSAETDRRARGVVMPDLEHERQQLQTMYLFDNIIGNIDRTQQNLLIDRNWRLWFIDHTRSFIKSARLVNPDQPTRCERNVWEHLKRLNEQEARRRLAPYLEKTEINFFLARWRKMVARIQALIDAGGEDAVLFELKDISHAPLRPGVSGEALKPAA